MKFGVVYSVDVPEDEDIDWHLPPVNERNELWLTTEGDECYDYDYLGGIWSKGEHRKMLAVLTKGEFERFLADEELFAEDVRTGGSLGVPWANPWYGLAPAVSFTSDACGAIKNAYVTPLPGIAGHDNEKPYTERDWERVRAAVIAAYS